MSAFNVYSNKDRKFVTEKKHRQNLSSQLKKSPQTIDQLRDMGVSEDKYLKLEFLFYTNTLEKAETLSKDLQSLGYLSKFGDSAGGNDKLVTGWSIPISMTVDAVLAWTKEMCEIGFKYDCEFDGWGTTPEQ